MRNPDDFDAFYKSARHRLLLQTYALTGDLPAARGAVRDAFVAAWHHWRKVSRLDDPESWVRPHAWQHAQRRHTARIWHRDKSLDPELRSTLDALAKLPAVQRRILLLAQLGSTSMAGMARELGLTDEVAEQQLQLATAHFAVHRDVPSTSIRHRLEQLASRTEDIRFPRPSIIRRAGAARRRAHTGAGLVAAVAALAVASSIVGRTDGVAPALDGVRATGPDRPAPQQAPPPLAMDDLITPEQAAALAPRGALGTPRTDDNTRGNGIYTACQRDRFADPDGVGALVRRFPAQSEARVSALQVVELSESARAAETAYDAMVGWYAGCTDDRVQLLATRRVTGAGDEGVLLVLRSWRAPVTTYSVGIARTGDLTTSVVRRAEDARPPSLRPLVQLLGSSVSGLCDHDRAGACTMRPRTTVVPPPAAESARGMLQVVDLPPVTGVDRPWVATDPTRPRLNPAATTCDKADFTGRTVRWAATRSLLIPQAALPDSFGVSETMGRFGSERLAREFVSTVRRRMAGCEDKDLTATLTPLHSQAGPRVDLSTWHLTSEFADDRTVEFYVALIRRDRVVAEVTFVPAKGAGFPRGAFHALALRALERIENLPAR